MFRTMRCKEHDHSSFYKFLQMEKNHKNTDCYFFYYSTCTKGDSCAYRHEASALGCETVCSYWQQGSCLNQHCNFRHMEIKKNRKVIPCYWEKFPTGCKKPHCPFLHRLNRAGITNPIEPVKAATVPAKPVNQEWSNRPDAKFDGNSTESDQGRGSSEAGSFIGSPVVDPLIVNFEEESDSESAPSPTKNPHRISSCKTYEEIRLEEIQAESAAFYSYADDYQSPTTTTTASSAERKAQRARSIRSQRMAATDVYGPLEPDDDLGFKVLSLDEIRKRKKEAALAAEEKEEAGLLRDALRSLDHLRDLKEIETSDSIIERQEMMEESQLLREALKSMEKTREKKAVEVAESEEDELLKEAVKSMERRKEKKAIEVAESKEDELLKDAVKSMERRREKKVVKVAKSVEGKLFKDAVKSMERARVKKVVKVAKNEESEFLKDAIKSLDQLKEKKIIKVAKKAEKQEETEFLKDAIKTLDQLKGKKEPEKMLVEEEPVKSEVQRTKKRSFGEMQVVTEEEESAKKSRTQLEETKVPPVRLKRRAITNPKEKEEAKATDTKKEEETRTEETNITTVVESAKSAEEEEVRLMQAKAAQKKVEEPKGKEDDVDSTSDRQDVEVRLCDSSTDDQKQSLDFVEEKNAVESLEEIVEQTTVCDSALKLDKKQLLSMDADDDILKDIDALLTDDSNS